MKRFLFLALMISLSRLLSAQVQIDDMMYNLDQEKKTAEFIMYNPEYDENVSDIVIPQYVNYEGADYEVVSIGLMNDEFGIMHSPFQLLNVFTVTLPSGIKNINSKAFYTASNVGAIIFEGAEPPYIDDDVVPYYNQTAIYVPEGSKQKYQTAEWWCKFEECQEYKNLEEITNPLSLVDVDNIDYVISRFNHIARVVNNYSDVELENVEIPSKISYEDEEYEVKMIDADAFSNKTFSSVTLPESIEKMGGFAFDACSRLGYIRCLSQHPVKVDDSELMVIYDQTELYVPKGSLAEYSQAEGWKNFKNIREWTDGMEVNVLKYVEINSFCYMLSDIDNSAKLVAYLNEENTDVVVPETIDYEGKVYEVKYISGSPFDNWFVTYDSVILPQNLKIIDSDVFGMFSCPAKLELPDHLEKIGNRSFLFCTLESITLPGTIKSIGKGAFAFSNNLKEIHSEIQNPIVIDETVFDFSDNQTLYVPFGTKGQYEATPSWNLFKNIIEEENTGIENVTNNVTDNNKTYNLQGVMVKNPLRGIYIRNGKKVLY